MDNRPPKTQPSGDKRYSSEAVQDILQRALTHQSNDGFTPMQLQEMAAELDIAPAVLQQAAIEWQFQQLQPDTIRKEPSKSKFKSKTLKLSAFLAAALLSGVAIPTTISVAFEIAADRQQAREVGAFLTSRIYTYDDAVALAKYWGQPVDEMKARIGNKLIMNSGGNLENIDDELEMARKAQTNSRNSSIQTEKSTISSYDETTQTEQAAFFSSDYTYDDAVALASFWGETLNDSKATIGRKILWGSENVAILNNNLKEARQGA